jgi:D-alanyl-D-alanine carboxypeptidase
MQSELSISCPANAESQQLKNNYTFLFIIFIPGSLWLQGFVFNRICNKMTRNTFIFFLFTAFLSEAVFAQTISKGKLDSLFNSLADNNKAMGSIAISKNGKLLYSRTIGYSLYCKEKKIPSDEDSKYRIGSISKIFTATIIFQLIEEGKINLTTTLDNYFPQYPNSALITISHLLNHRSGIRNINTIESKETPRTQEEMLKVIAEKIPKYKPGKKSSYSNSNYLLLGYIIEKICRKSYADVLQEKIVSRIGLRNTYYGHKTDIEKDECFPYKFIYDWEQQPETDPSIPGASGALVSTPRDVILFIEALFAKKLTSQHSLDQMRTIRDGYGMGFLEFEFNKKKALGYTGGIDGYESVLAYFPGDSIAIAYCSNANIYPVRSIVIGALNIYYHKPFSIPDFKLITVKAANLKKYIGVYSSDETPLRIRIIRGKGGLVAQPVGFSSYLLEAIASDKFKNDEASVIIEFDPQRNAMKLKRGDLKYNFIKED